MGVTALGLLTIGLVNCFIITQTKSKIPFLLFFIHPFIHPLVQEALLGASYEFRGQTKPDRVVSVL